MWLKHPTCQTRSTNEFFNIDELCFLWVSLKTMITGTIVEWDKQMHGWGLYWNITITVKSECFKMTALSFYYLFTFCWVWQRQWETNKNLMMRQANGKLEFNHVWSLQPSWRCTKNSERWFPQKQSLYSPDNLLLLTTTFFWDPARTFSLANSKL